MPEWVHVSHPFKGEREMPEPTFSGVCSTCGKTLGFCDHGVPMPDDPSALLADAIEGQAVRLFIEAQEAHSQPYPSLMTAGINAALTRYGSLCRLAGRWEEHQRVGCPEGVCTALVQLEAEIRAALEVTG